MISTDDKVKFSKTVVVQGGDCNGLTLFTALVSPNPVANQELRMTVSAAKEDNLVIKVLDMKGQMTGQYTSHVNAGTNQVIIHLSQNAGAQYMLNIYSPKNGTITQKILVD
jgi:hypothetical protein